MYALPKESCPGHTEACQRRASSSAPARRGQVQDARNPPSYYQQLHEGCAALQGIGVPPHQVKISMLETKRMLIQLFKMGVKPETLLLPRRPDRGYPRMCCLESLQALIDYFVERSKYGDFSRHKEVGGAVGPLTCKGSALSIPDGKVMLSCKP